jgi:hypothetical protein
MGTPPISPQTPPTPPTADPDIPVSPTPIRVTVTDVADHEVDPKQRAKLEVAGYKESGWAQALFAALWASVIDGLLLLVSLWGRVANFLLAAIARIVREAQGEEHPEFWEFVGKLVEDLTGIEVDTDKLKTAYFGSGRIAGMNELGKGIFNLLAEEFLLTEEQSLPGMHHPRAHGGIGDLPTVGLSPRQGVDAARRFLGFAMSWAVREGNVAALGEVAGLGAIENFRQYGVAMSRNIGIGRLVRMALRPLVDVTVATPLEWALNKQYRPKLLTPASATHAWLAGKFTAEQLLEECRLQGYSEDRISALITQAIRDLTPHQIGALLSTAQITEEDARTYLKRTGYNDENVDLYFRAEEAIALQGAQQILLSRGLNELVEGSLEPSEFDALMDRIGFTEAFKRKMSSVAGELTRMPRKSVSWGEMRKAFLDGITDIREVEDYLIRTGYRQSDRQLRLIQLLTDGKKKAEADKARAEREAEREAKRAAAAAKAAETAGS